MLPVGRADIAPLCFCTSIGVVLPMLDTVGQGCQTQIHRGPKLKMGSKSMAGHIQYLLGKKDILYFFACKHSLKFNVGLLNLGQAA